MFSEVTCWRCDASLPRLTETLLFHAQVCHEELHDGFACCICHYITKNWGNITSHIRHHIGDKPFQCSYCPYSSTQGGNLRTHHKKRHPDEEMPTHPEPLCRVNLFPVDEYGSYLKVASESFQKCRHCNTELRGPSVETLISHILTCDSIELSDEHKNFSCCFCMYQSDSMVYITKHLTEHVFKKSQASNKVTKRSYARTTRPPSLVLTDNVECRFCSVSLPRCTQTLISHKKQCSIKVKFDKVHICFICDYESDVSSDMKRHIRAHLGVKPFKCAYCSFSATQRQNLKKHILSVHPDEENIILLKYWTTTYYINYITCTYYVDEQV